MRSHDLRHIFATMSLEYGMDIKTLASTLGHASAETTLNIYSHVTDELRRTAAEKIDRAMGRPGRRSDVVDPCAAIAGFVCAAFARKRSFTCFPDVNMV